MTDTPDTAAHDVEGRVERAETPMDGGYAIVRTVQAPFLSFIREGKQATLDVRDGKLEFSGDLPIGEAAHLLFDGFLGKVAVEAEVSRLQAERDRLRARVDALEKALVDAQVSLDPNMETGWWVSYGFLLDPSRTARAVKEANDAAE